VFGRLVDNTAAPSNQYPPVFCIAWMTVSLTPER
jgi:hypothetical protein